MKRPARSDSSFGAFMAICPTTEEQSPGGSSHVYSRDFQSMLEGLDEEGCVEESGHIAEKKRRLSVDQVKALEKNFEIENKLEPERKVKLAQELGLQPRQVAVWFQNRRARYKTKQLERDYGILKANFDSLKLSYESLQFQNDSLLKEVRELEMKLKEENETEVENPNKEQMVVAESKNIIHMDEMEFKDGSIPSKDKDGSSDSDSSAILNEEHSPVAVVGSSSLHQNPHHVFPAFTLGSNSNHDHQSTDYQPQHYVKTEEHNFFGVEEPCNFFAEDQAPSLQWCWN